MTLEFETPLLKDPLSRLSPLEDAIFILTLLLYLYLKILFPPNMSNNFTIDFSMSSSGYFSVAVITSRLTKCLKRTTEVDPWMSLSGTRLTFYRLNGAFYTPKVVTGSVSQS